MTAKERVLSLGFVLAGCSALTGWAYLIANTDRLDDSPASIMVFQFTLPVLALVLIALNFASRTVKQNALLLFTSSLIGLYLVDASLAIYGGSPYVKELHDNIRRGNAADLLNMPYDGRKRSEVIADERRRGHAVVPPIYPTNLLVEDTNGEFGSAIIIDGKEILPLGGISKKSHVFCNEIGPWIQFDSDKYGLNNPSGIWPTAGDHAARVSIVAIGDSFTHGSCVPSEQHMISLIRTLFPQTLNLGGAGMGPLSQLSALREYGPIAKPKVILWFYYEGNDLADLDIEKRVPILRRYLDSTYRQGLPSQQAMIDKALTGWVENQIRLGASKKLAFFPVLRTKDILLLRNIRHRLGLRVFQAPDLDQAPPDMTLFRQIAMEMQKTADAWRAHLMLVYLPDIHNFCDRTTKIDCRRVPGEYLHQRDAKSQLLTIAREAGFEVVDILSAFAKLENPLSAWPRLDGHYSPVGYQVVARAVIDRLTTLKRPSARKTSGKQSGPRRSLTIIEN